MKKLYLVIVGLGLIGLASGCTYSTSKMPEILYEETSAAVPEAGSDVVVPEEGTRPEGSDDVITPEEFAGDAAPDEVTAPDAGTVTGTEGGDTDSDTDSDTGTTPPPASGPIVVDIDPSLFREPSRLPGGVVLRDPPLALLPPAVSCDEPSFAFVSNQTGRDQIHATDPSGSRTLSDNRWDHYHYRRLSLKPGTSSFAVDSGPGELFVVHQGDLTGASALTPLITEDPVFTHGFAWNHDGNKWAYIASYGGDGDLVHEIRLDGTVDSSGGMRVMVSNDNASDHPSHGPGVRFEKVTWAGQYQLVYSLKDSFGDYYLHTVLWSRNSGEIRTSVPIAYPTADREGGVPLDGTRLDGREPAASPDGRKIAFAQLQGGIHHIVLCELPLFDGGESPYRAQCDSVRTLTRVGANTSPAWSPDSRWIYFVSDRPGHSGNKEIYRVRPDGTGEERLTNDPAEDTSPAPFAPYASCE